MLAIFLGGGGGRNTGWLSFQNAIAMFSLGAEIVQNPSLLDSKLKIVRYSEG